MKYICTIDDTGVELLFTFPRAIRHDLMFECIRCLGIGPLALHGEAISAGFVDSEGNCFGRSETLNLNSRPALDKLLLVSQQSHGVVPL